MPHLLACSFFFRLMMHIQYNITFFCTCVIPDFLLPSSLCTYTLAQSLYFKSSTFHLKLLCPADAPSTNSLWGILSSSPTPAKMFPVSSTNDTGTSTCVNIYCVTVLYLTSHLQLPRQQPKERKLKSPRRQRLPRILLPGFVSHASVVPTHNTSAQSGLRECQVLAASWTWCNGFC